MNRILLVEDDFTLGDVIKKYLNGIGYQTIWAQNGADGFRLFNTENVELCLVDIGLPDKDGFNVVKDMKELNKGVPIIFLTARNQITDKIHAYDIGADDYLCKPFEIRELELRINAITRRFKKTVEQVDSAQFYTIGSFRFDYLLRRLKYENKTVKLSHIDCELLKLLYTNRNTYIKNEVILRAIWGNDEPQTAKRLSVYINRLRNLFKSDENIVIYNVYGVGYKLQIESPISNAEINPKQS
jgi:DNA-binding response OmpR family regulator